MTYKYYNGIRLPEIPSDKLSSYPYAILQRSSTGYNLYLCTTPFYYSSNYGNASAGGSGSFYNYSLTDEQLGADSDWVFRNTTEYDISDYIWTNRSLGVHSTDLTTANIQFHATQPTPTPVRLVNQAQASVGNNVASSCTLTMTGCTPGNMLVLAYATRGGSNVIAVTEGWTVLGGRNNITDSADTAQGVYFAFKKVENSEETVTISQTVQKRLYLVCGEFYGVTSVIMRNDLAALGSSNYTVTGTKTYSGDLMLYATSSAYYFSGRQQTVSPTDLTKLVGDLSSERLACWFDAGDGATEHSFQTYPATESSEASLECVQLLSEDFGYPPKGTAEIKLPQKAQVSSYSASAITWEQETPEGTECHVYLLKGDSNPVECTNGEPLPGLLLGEDLSNTKLTLQVVLATTDSTKTPSISNIQVEIRSTEDNKYLVLSFAPGNTTSIQNAVGAVRCSYAGGTLMGAGGAVAPFATEFTPTGLYMKPNPHDGEHIEVIGATHLGDLISITYLSAKDRGEHLEVIDAAWSATLTHINDL